MPGRSTKGRADEKSSSSFPSCHCLTLIFFLLRFGILVGQNQQKKRLHTVFCWIPSFVGFHPKCWKISEGSLFCEVGKGVEFHLLKGEISAH